MGSITKDDILKILVEEIRGDGQGYPNQDEREAAAERIMQLIGKHYG